MTINPQIPAPISVPNVTLLLISSRDGSISPSLEAGLALFVVQRNVGEVRWSPRLGAQVALHFCPPVWGH